MVVRTAPGKKRKRCPFHEIPYVVYLVPPRNCYGLLGRHSPTPGRLVGGGTQCAAGCTAVCRPESGLQTPDNWIAQPNSEDTEACVAYCRRAGPCAYPARNGMSGTGSAHLSVVFEFGNCSTPSVIIGVDLDQGQTRLSIKRPRKRGGLPHDGGADSPVGRPGTVRLLYS